MSGDQLALSFGDPNAQPPTPKQTPTSTIFPSPVFSTPKNDQGRFDDSSGWTPRFAEEYSVFNATPGNLRGNNQGTFADFSPAGTPYILPASQKRPLSAGGIAAEIATHANHFSPQNPSLLPPVEPSRRLQSSPGPLTTSGADTEQPSDSSERSAKKARRGTLIEKDGQEQTATPPPSARKGERRISPKLDTTAMQNDHGFGQPDFMGTPQQQQQQQQQHQQPGMGHFVTTPTDMLGYPLSAPNTAPIFMNQRPFWDTDMGGGMNIDFSAASTGVFQNQNNASHRPMGSVDWGRSNQIFQETGIVPDHGDGDGNAPAGHQQQQQQQQHERRFVSQAPMQTLVTPSSDQSMFGTTYQTSVEDPFGIVNGGVDPGLLYSHSRPQSSSMDTTTSFHASMQTQSMTAVPLPQEAQQLVRQGRLLSKASVRAEVRRSVSVKEVGPSKQNRAPASSPIKSSGCAGLSRSFSENRGKKPVARASFPALAPAPRPQSQLLSNAGVNANRPVISQPSKPSGRSSPLKSHHQRLSSLSSIPEQLPRTRTQAKFTIDANGRARVETTVVLDDKPPLRIRKRHTVQPVTNHRHWNSTDDDGEDVDDDSSSTDDDPIIIPSRNTSFTLPMPTPRKSSAMMYSFHNPQHSLSERSTTSYTTFKGGSQGDDESDEAKTPMKGQTPTTADGNKPSGDAASELRKLRENRPKPLPLSSTKQKRVASAGHGVGAAGFAGNYHGHNTHNNNMSPTTLTDTSLPTPSSSDSRRRGIRCICNRPEVDQGDNFLVQCESCEMWLHTRCVDITERTRPSIYICAFCADTPHARGGKMRHNNHNNNINNNNSSNGHGHGRSHSNGRGAQGGGVGLATSPLAHKSYKFR
ncbi:hypothetical protein B0T17DRAFT_282238 [Bombardia bombarda]|uniref:PHD-type domain-containing protein n=1 Tax=Bombardia bombarda TaxID=252184 RepID=A0AA40C1G7_9PEZI|nr:hypothetical protein B0T17DRAFT_282238 [Bombardia bombarda]